MMGLGALAVLKKPETSPSKIEPPDAVLKKPDIVPLLVPPLAWLLKPGG
jgi:hypothetical protein